jgi:primosomal protein N' (replication factor Y)
VPDSPHETLGPARIARVLPDVTGLDKEFDYLIPDDLVGRLAVGEIVRVRLHGRSVRGWVTALDPTDGVVEASKLQPIVKRSSVGPSPELVDLARWASIRWAAGRLRPFLVTGSPPVNVPAVDFAPPGVSIERPASVVAQGTDHVLDAGGGTLLLPPATSPIDAIVSAATRGRALAVMPTAARAEAMAAALQRRGLRTAVVPHQWARAASGVDVVIGARAAAWAPCPALSVAIVIDEHDETLQEERAPTWHARDVLVERARRAGVPLLATSPCPSVSGVAAIGEVVEQLPVNAERAGWPIVDVIDRSDEEPWKLSLLSSPLIRELRRPDARVVCVHNTPGRGRVLACRTCRALARCERCDAAVSLSDESTFHCARCGAERPPVCLECGASGFANLRPGVTRLREELEAAAGRPVVAVTGADDERPADAGVYVGTEAVLHRVDRANVVAFLDFDRELLAPRYRANEQAMALLTKAARLLGPRERGGRLMVQTFLPRHEVIQAALLAEPLRLLDPERKRRELFGMPPATALAHVSGPGSGAVIDQLRGVDCVTIGGAVDNYLVRAATWEELGRALVATERPKGSRIRVAVDPPRV